MKKLIYLIIAAATVSASCKKEIASVEKSTTADQAQSVLTGKINAVITDKNGLVWTATDNGLIKGLGSNAVIYTPANSFLMSGIIQALALGTNNTVWIGTNKGLIKYDGTHWSIFTTDNGMLTDDNVKHISYNANKKETVIELKGGGQKSFKD